MGDGRGAFVAAGIFGLVVTVGGVGIVIGSGYSPAPDYPTYVSAAKDAKQDNVRVVRTPCVNMVSRDESDLCAQWKAANAGSYGAIWSFVQALLSAAGILGLVATLLYNRRALVATDQTSRDARRIGEAQVRAYLDIDDVKVKITSEGMAEVSLKIENAGQSPARSVKVASVVRLVALSKKLDESYGCVGHLPIVSVQSGRSIIIARQSSEVGIGQQISDALDDSTVITNLSVVITVKYRDVFKDNHEIVRAFITTKVVKRDIALPMNRPDELNAMVSAELARRNHLNIP